MSKRQFPKNEGYNRIPRFSYVTSNLSKRFSENLMHVLDNEFFETFCSVHWIGGWEFGNKKQNFVANSKSQITMHHDTSRHITITIHERKDVSKLQQPKLPLQYYRLRLITTIHVSSCKELPLPPTYPNPTLPS
jgi:hypothetical protein